MVKVPNQLSELDQTLIATMRARSGVSISELSRVVGVARATVQSRLLRLRDRGVILGYGPDVDAAAAGFDVLAFVTVEIAQGAHDDTVNALRAIPEILEIHTVTGPGDLLCRVVARNNDHLHQVLQRVAQVDEVARTESHLALSSPVVRTVADLFTRPAA